MSNYYFAKFASAGGTSEGVGREMLTESQTTVDTTYIKDFFACRFIVRSGIDEHMKTVALVMKRDFICLSFRKTFFVAGRIFRFCCT